jgi:phenylpyruvate tautomerase PptA (4-oxalocrotonate tautomerase family)
MPIMQVSYPAGTLDAVTKAALAGGLTDVLLTMEGGARTAGGLAFATVLFSQVSPEDWFVGGRSDDTHVHPPGKFLVRVTIPEGYMSQAHKSEVHAMVNETFLKVLGNDKSASTGGSILVTIEEITEGDWGCAGRTISLASIADSVGLPAAGPRFRWVLDYFAAKARMFKSAGYPSDTGGLLPAKLSANSSKR